MLVYGFSVTTATTKFVMPSSLIYPFQLRYTYLLTLFNLRCRSCNAFKWFGIDPSWHSNGSDDTRSEASEFWFISENLWQEG